MSQGRYDSASVHHDDAHDGAMPLGFDLSEALDVVSHKTRENPHAALAAGTAIGFVLGGGMTPKLMGAIALFVARRYFQAAVDESLASLQGFAAPAQPKL
jgi:hypothetical protein